MAVITKAKLNRRIQELKAANFQLKQDSDTKFAQKQADFQSQLDIKENRINELEAEIAQNKEDSSLREKELSEKLEIVRKSKEIIQKQLDQRELKKLAEAYAEQETNYQGEITQWLKYSAYAGAAWAVVTLIILWVAYSKPWNEKAAFYVLDVIPISVIWFCVSEFSYYSKLKNDFANRKTIAQSYHNILNGIEDEVDEGEKEIKSKFIEKATDVLCAPSISDNKEPLLSKKILKDLAEILRTIRPT